MKIKCNFAPLKIRLLSLNLEKEKLIDYQRLVGEDKAPKQKKLKNKMDTLSYKTISANEKIVKKEWVVIDAENEVVGRLSTMVARILRGKNKTYFTPHFDCGDNVIIINAEKIRFTGKKMDDKVYVRHTGYPGGQRFATPKELMRKNPIKILEHAVRGMLPKNKLGDQLYRNLYVYVGNQHPHEGQQPKLININEIK
jgi:large subunit ribosomal protein L13